MARDIIASRRTSFTPQHHGFHFSNSRLRWNYLGFSGTAMCGGMAFASLDYFRRGLRIPPDTSAPAVGSALNRYLLERQIDAHNYAIPRLLTASASSDIGQFRSGTRVDDRFGVVMRWIERNWPVPVLLMDREDPLSTNSHWVVAIGYEMDEVPPNQGGRRLGSLILYDNNHPNSECRLSPTPHGWYDHSRGARYRTYFPYDGFVPRDPRRPAQWNPPV
jgi:hypothetical protein